MDVEQVLLTVSCSTSPWIPLGVYVQRTVVSRQECLGRTGAESQGHEPAQLAASVNGEHTGSQVKVGR